MRERVVQMRREKRCYLSGPITGVDGYMEKFDKYEHKLTQMFGWSVINPARVNSGMPFDTDYGDYMEMSETMMRMCDRIFLMPGWEKSKGAKFEREFAIIHGMDVFEENQNGEIFLSVGGGSNGR